MDELKVIQLDSSSEAQRRVIQLQGSLTSKSIGELRTHLDPILQGEASELQLKMDTLNHIDSLGIGVLIFYFNQLEKKGGKLSIGEPTEAVLEILRLTSLDKVIPIS